jgi:cold shock CspA family protein
MAKVGQAVEIRARGLVAGGGERFIPATITAIDGDGTLRITTRGGRDVFVHPSAVRRDVRLHPGRARAARLRAGAYRDLGMVRNRDGSWE